MANTDNTLIPNEYQRYEDGLIQGIGDSIGEIQQSLMDAPPFGGQDNDEEKPETYKEKRIVPQKNNGGGDSSSDDNDMEFSDDEDMSDMTPSQVSERAQKFADKAKRSAESAEQSANKAQKSAGNAKSEADKAKSKFGENSNEYSEAKDLANEAQEAANDARKAAEDAKKSADQAQTAADNSKSAAEKGDMETARREAENAKKHSEDAENANADSKMNSWFSDDAAKESKENNRKSSHGKSKNDTSNMSADEAAEEAQNAADAAQDAANDAQEAANDAQENADELSDAAEKARQKYGTGSDKYKSAKDEADKAQQAADKAQEHANNAQDAANDAQEAADKANESAAKGDTKSARENAKKAQEENNKAQEAADKAVDAADNQMNGKNSSSSNSQNWKNGDKNQSDQNNAGGNDGNQQRSIEKQHGYSEYDDSIRKEKNRKRKQNKNDNIPEIRYSENGSGGKNRFVGEIIKQSEINGKLGDSLRRSGFDDATASKIMSNIQSKDSIDTESVSKLRDDIIKNKPNSTLGKICTSIKMKDAVMDELWQEIIKTFLEDNTLYAGKRHKIPDKHRVRWGDRRTIAHDMIRPYHPKNDAAPQYINIFVDTSISVNYSIIELFANTIVNCCDKLAYSGITLIPFATNIDFDAMLHFEADYVKEHHDSVVTQIINMCQDNVAGSGTNIGKCVNYIIKTIENDRHSVWLFLTDGEFSGRTLGKLLAWKKKILFLIYNHNIRKQFKKHLKWCVNPALDQLKRCYIELDENAKKDDYED